MLGKQADPCVVQLVGPRILRRGSSDEKLVRPPTLRRQAFSRQQQGVASTAPYTAQQLGRQEWKWNSVLDEVRKVAGLEHKYLLRYYSAFEISPVQVPRARRGCREVRLSRRRCVIATTTSSPW